MAMEWLELKATTKAGLAAKHSNEGRSVIYQVLAPAGHNGVGHNGKHKLVDPEAFLDNAIQEYGKEVVSRVFFKQFVVQAQARPRKLMEDAAMDSTILAEMKSWKLNEKARTDAKATEKIVMDRWMAEFNAATTIEGKMAVLQRMQQRHHEISQSSDSTTEEEEEENGNGGTEDTYEEDNNTEESITDDEALVANLSDLSTDSLESRNEPNTEEPNTEEPNTEEPVRGPSGRFQRRTH